MVCLSTGHHEGIANMDILTRIRNTTPESLEGVRSDFDDLPTPVYVSPRSKEMIRTVEGADDLKHPNAGRTSANAGKSIARDWTGSDELHRNGEPCNCPGKSVAPKDARSEGQIRYMDNLITWISEKDQAAGDAARAWTDNVTAAGKWSYDKADKFSISSWIDRLKAKNAALKNAQLLSPTPPATIQDDTEFQGIPNGYYAVGDAGPDDIHFFRVSRFRDGGIKVQEQASDTLHPVRRGGRRTAILRAILTVGPAAASALYGQTIGRCGRCNRTLTDALSRSRGIGPDCWDKM